MRRKFEKKISKLFTPHCHHKIEIWRYITIFLSLFLPLLQRINLTFSEKIFTLKHYNFTIFHMH